MTARDLEIINMMHVDFSIELQPKLGNSGMSGIAANYYL